MTKAEYILQKNANKTMHKWELNNFKITHPTLYKTIIDSINEAINYTHCCRQLFKLRDNCVNGVDDEVCKNSGICKYCS
jgi:hypothetical protein